jgi:hypothetical protein
LVTFQLWLTRVLLLGLSRNGAPFLNSFSKNPL